jgi:NADH-quinone oxidoreductase subunit M
LPDAHVEAPTPISMILAGVLLKMGGYGIIRIAYPICPWAAEALAWYVSLFGIINIVYGAFAAMAQTDFKKLVAYSSISHMGYVILGIAVWSAVPRSQYWAWGTVSRRRLCSSGSASSTPAPTTATWTTPAACTSRCRCTGASPP